MAKNKGGNLKIQRIELTNFKAHKKQKLDINGNNVYLIGSNGVGKSSIIDALGFALDPNRETNATRIPNPVSKGKEKGQVVVVVGNNDKQYTVTRSFKKDQTTKSILIETPEGFRETTLRALENLIGYKDIDPMEFVELGESEAGRRKQLELILGPNNLNKYMALRETAVGAKKELNDVSRELNYKKAEYEATKAEISPADLLKYTDAETQNPAELSQKIEDAIKFNSKIQSAENEIQRIDREIIGANQEIERLLSKVNSLKASITSYGERKAELREVTKNEPIDIGNLRERFNEIGKHNNMVLTIKDLKEKEEKLLAMEKEHSSKEAVTAKAAHMIMDFLEHVDTPIKGLSISHDGVVTFKGLPLSDKQQCTSELMNLGFTMALHYEDKENLNLLRIRRAESLDQKGLDALEKFASNHPKWQLFVERVIPEGKLALEFFDNDDQQI